MAVAGLVSILQTSYLVFLFKNPGAGDINTTIQCRNILAVVKLLPIQARGFEPCLLRPPYRAAVKVTELDLSYTHPFSESLEAKTMHKEVEYLVPYVPRSPAGDLEIHFFNHSGSTASLGPKFTKIFVHVMGHRHQTFDKNLVILYKTSQDPTRLQDTAKVLQGRKTANPEMILTRSLVRLWLEALILKIEKLVGITRLL
ncbi:hypothetical protein K438DRAFT_1756214 [Mycena galopus ATCC 62051]|nr:hypothetical protein K438DRAFT_1756214 [Mycena galopus ATCC 62051]